jgi:DNA-binding CsgD family transcriptional regulator
VIPRGDEPAKPVGEPGADGLDSYRATHRRRGCRGPFYERLVASQVPAGRGSGCCRRWTTRSLTSRPSERSVAELAALGHTNREIADRLVLSVRTVESHLASAYRKLNIRSRVQLARAARGTTEDWTFAG